MVSADMDMRMSAWPGSSLVRAILVPFPDRHRNPRALFVFLPLTSLSYSRLFSLSHGVMYGVVGAEGHKALVPAVDLANLRETGSSFSLLASLPACQLVC
jgi:hypothetical protein